MKVYITNLTQHNKFVSLDNSGDIDKVICLGPHARVLEDVSSERTFADLSKKFKGLIRLSRV